MTEPVKLTMIPEDVTVGYAIQALAKGEADPEQQAKAFNWIVSDLSGAYAMSIDFESTKKSDFNEGKRHVGRCLVGILTTNFGTVKAVDTIKEVAKDTTKNQTPKRRKKRK